MAEDCGGEEEEGEGCTKGVRGGERGGGGDPENRIWSEVGMLSSLLVHKWHVC